MDDGWQAGEVYGENGGKGRVDVSDFFSDSISGAEILILIIPPQSNLSPNTDAAICLLCLIALSPLSRPNYFLSYLIIFANDLIRE